MIDDATPKSGGTGGVPRPESGRQGDNERPSRSWSSDESVKPSLADYRRIVLITEGFSTPFLSKTAVSLLRYRTADIVAVLDSHAEAPDVRALFGVDADVPVVRRLSEVEGADALFAGIAPPGGRIPVTWRPILKEAIERGLDVVAGMHDFLTDDPELVRMASEHGRQLIDVRRNTFKETAEGHVFPPGCVRIQTVGHDCSIGKMVVALELQRELARRGHDAAFLATGQTGIMVSGKGVPADCVVADFINAAVEQLVRDHEQHEFLLIEGQGSLSHPAFSAVTLGLLHGAAPNGLVYCYEAGRDFVKGLDNVAIPPHATIMAALEAVARLRHPCRVIGVAINTRSLSPSAAAEEVQRAAATFGLPACDVYRDGAGVLADAALAMQKELVTQQGRMTP